MVSIYVKSETEPSLSIVKHRIIRAGVSTTVDVVAKTESLMKMGQAAPAEPLHPMSFIPVGIVIQESVLAK